jgi:hypothetical protein
MFFSKKGQNQNILCIFAAGNSEVGTQVPSFITLPATTKRTQHNSYD